MHLRDNNRRLIAAFVSLAVALGGISSGCRNLNQTEGSAGRKQAVPAKEGLAYLLSSHQRALDARDLPRLMELVHTTPKDQELVSLWFQMGWLVEDERKRIRQEWHLPAPPEPSPPPKASDFGDELVVSGGRAELIDSEDGLSVLRFIRLDGHWKFDFSIVEYRSGTREQTILGLRRLVALADAKRRGRSKTQSPFSDEFPGFSVNLM